MRTIEKTTDELLSLPSIFRSLLAGKLVESIEFEADFTQTTSIMEAKKRRDEVLAQIWQLLFEFLAPWRLQFGLDGDWRRSLTIV